MVNPLYLFAASLAVAFILPLLDSLARRLSLLATFAVLGAWLVVAGSWLWQLASGAAASLDFGTAGFSAPLAIMLRVGPAEAAAVAAIALVGFMATLVMAPRLAGGPIGSLMALLMLLMGLSGIVLTRDLFNLFVFLEISSIATYGLIVFDNRRSALRSGFKYMIAGGLASALHLIGIIYVYRFTGQLNLDLAIAAAAAGKLAGVAGSAAVFFLLAALLVELKPFPANGWALDVYQGADASVSALLSGASATALLLAVWKIMPLLTPAHLAVVAGSGLATFVAGNLGGARQSDSKRLLGYSSVAQVGLVLAVIALSGLYDFGTADTVLLIAGGLLLNHLLAKTGLFLLAGWLESRQAAVAGRAAAQSAAAANGADGKNSATYRFLIVLAGVLAVALVGLPPFPGFWAKWQLISRLMVNQLWWLTALILAGSLVEAFYILRWFGSLVHDRADEAAAPEAPAAAARKAVLAALSVPDKRAETAGSAGQVSTAAVIFAAAVLGALLAAAGIYLGWLQGLRDLLAWAPFAAVLLVYVLDWLPGRLKSLCTLVLIALFGWLAFDRLDGLRQLFALMLLGGGALFAVAAMYKAGPRRGLFPLLAATVLAMGTILLADSALRFFLAWEAMTLASYLLVLRGKSGEKAALAYITFGLGGAFLLMAGLLGGAKLWGFAAGGMLAAGAWFSWPLLLAILGILVKLGALGLHVWLPAAYAEAEDEISGFLSASLSKAGVFALLAVLATTGLAAGEAAFSLRLLGWLGLATALFGALYAIYQEDIKQTLAWSSMGQIGYIILALALNDQAGWTTALYLAVNHFLYKGMLFLAVTGVILRVGTRNMYEMGGLIKRMPFSFLTVLMAIIALSGVPPLSGFGGKWLLYSALLARGWYFETALAFFASGVAFLYLYRLIHSIFLGQAKPSQSLVREAPLALLVPQGLLMASLLAVSAFPSLMLKPLMAVVGERFGAGLAFSGPTLVSPLGYWNGTQVMVVTAVVFGLCFVWMLANLHNPQGVKQFNIVFAAERPYKPETTHYAWSFFKPYERALGFLTRQRAERFWAGFGSGVTALGGIVRRLNTGNGQTYALHIILYVAILYLITGAL